MHAELVGILYFVLFLEHHHQLQNCKNTLKNQEHYASVNCIYFKTISLYGTWMHAKTENSNLTNKEWLSYHASFYSVFVVKVLVLWKITMARFQLANFRFFTWLQVWAIFRLRTCRWWIGTLTSCFKTTTTSRWTFTPICPHKVTTIYS